MTYTRDDLPALPDPVEFIRQRPYMFLTAVSGEVLAQRLAEEARLLDAGEIVSKRDGSWWIVAAEKDWLRVRPELSIEDLFTRIVPFPEAGTNSMRAEVLLTAFAGDVVTLARGRPQIIKGRVAANEVARLSAALEREWGRVVAFRLRDEEEPR